MTLEIIQIESGENMKTIHMGIFIKNRRENYQLTQQELADKLGVTQRLVAQWEAGERVPHTSRIPRLCEELHINVYELLSGKKLTEEEEKLEIEQSVLLLLKTNHKLKKFKIFHKMLCCIGLIAVLACGKVMYYVWCSSHPDVRILIQKHTFKETIGVEDMAISFGTRIEDTSPVLYLNLYRLGEESQGMFRHIKNNYKAADIKLEIEEKGGQTILRYTGPATTLEDELIEFEKEVVLDFSYDAKVKYRY